MNESHIALIISSLSLSLSFWAVFKDRNRLAISSQFIDAHPDYGPDRISFRAVNKGKRPIYLRAIGGKLEKGGWLNIHIGDGELGKKLEEGQNYEDEFKIDDIEAEGPDFSDQFIELWIEDSLGRRHKIPKSRKFINRLITNHAACATDTVAER